MVITCVVRVDTGISLISEILILEISMIWENLIQVNGPFWATHCTPSVKWD